MADMGYKTFPATLQSKGVVARYTDDTLPVGTYLTMQNMEEQSENAVSSRLGSVIVNAAAGTVFALAGVVNTIAKLLGFGNVWRYAMAGPSLYRRAGSAQGQYSSIENGFSGNSIGWACYRPDLSSYPYIFFADSNQMLKDNGSFVSGSLQQWGIFQPMQPVIAVAQAPQKIVLDEFNVSAGLYTLVNYTSFGTPSKFSTTTTSAIIIAGTQTVTVASTANMQLYSLVDIGSEVVQIIAMTKFSITGNFTAAHASGTTVSTNYLQGTVATSTTATITRAGSYGLATFPNTVAVNDPDYLAIFLKIDNPNNIQEIRLQFDVGDGTFTSNYFYKVISPAQYQSSVSDTVTPAQAVAQSIYSAAVNVFGPGQINVAALTTGQNIWSPVLTQLSDFVGVGNADVNSLSGFSFASVVAFQISITTNTNGAATVGISDLVCFGGAGPDSFAGVSYDWLYTYYNANTGAESNPCMSMSNIDPPQNTTFITPRRQPVTLTILPSTDPQVTHTRVYRRGGTLASNYYRVDQIAATLTSYTDISADDDIEASTPVSFTNDVPVTSTLPVPVSTTLTSPIGNGGVISFPVASATNISVHQQLTLGEVTDPQNEIVIVKAVSGNLVTAYIQNTHAAGVVVTAEAVYGQPCNICAEAYSAMYLAGDPNNPHYLYYSTNYSPEYFGSANFIEIGNPGDPIMAIVPFRGTLYVATFEHWYVVAPSTQTGAAPTVYPTSAVHGVVGRNAWVATEAEIWYQAIDGIRTFNGSNSEYRTQELEMLFQGASVNYIPGVAQSTFAYSQSSMTYWNNVVFFAYLASDGMTFHRLMFHTIYKRWRNDDLGATAMYTEPDTNMLLFGDKFGLVRQDRVGSSDQSNNGGQLATTPIALNLQTGFQDQGMPKNQKNYNELTIDANTNGQLLTPTLYFDDFDIVTTLPAFMTTERSKVNININAGLGVQSYRVSLAITGQTTSTATIFEVDIRAVVLSETRQSQDTYWLKFGTDESKILKQLYIEYISSAPITYNLYYDQFVTPQYTFTIPASPLRTSLRVRLPAIKFRLFRMVGTSTADFLIWPDSKFEVKPVCSTKGYEVAMMQL